MLEEFPEHDNGDADITIARFKNLEQTCEAEIQRYARQPQEIDLVNPRDRFGYPLDVQPDSMD